MSGTIPLSLSQQFDRYGKPLSGGLLYLIQAGTTSTPQSGYQDSDLTIALPNPIKLDAAGRLPQFFLADGLIKFRLVDKDGVQQFTADGVQIIGPSSGGGGGGGTVDPTTIAQTGDVLWLDVSGTRDGWVRDNGRSLGSASSGATERASADCEALFGFLWQKYSNTICPVAGGRGASAAADWSADKTIQLPDKRLYIPGGLADMGNTALVLPTGVPIVSGDATTAGSRIGATLHTLTAAQLAEHTHGGRTDFMDSNQSHSHSTNAAANNGGATTGGGSFTANDPAGATINPANIDHRHYFTTDTGSGVTGSAHNNTQLTVLGTFYRKL
jgi:hypothetical protein